MHWIRLGARHAVDVSEAYRFGSTLTAPGGPVSSTRSDPCNQAHHLDRPAARGEAL
jgi:hypothetical protein